MNENELWQKVCEQESIDMCNQYLTNCPFGLHVKDVQNKLKILQGCNTVDVRFLKKYVNDGIITLQGLMSAGLNEQKVDMIRQSLGINEDELWQNACTQQTAEAYGEYLKFFPAGNYAVQARQQKERIEDSPWFDACQQNTRSAFEAYRQQYPGKHAEELNIKLAAIEAREILIIQFKQDEDDWKQACLTNDYNGYLAKHPDGKYATEAQNRLQEGILRQDEADWQQACANYDFPGYLAKHPNGKHAEEAHNRQQGASIILNMQADPNAYFAGDLQQYVRNGTISQNDLLRIYGPEKANAIMAFSTPSQLPEGLPPIQLASNTTEVYFWGTPSSGKTCAMGALISSAGNKGILEKLQCSGYDYMTRLSNIFNPRGFCTFPYSTSVETIQEMSMRLLDDDNKNHTVTLVDLAGELFRSVYSKNHNQFLDAAKEQTLETAMSYLKDRRNKKIHFFVVEYGAHEKTWENYYMKDYLSEMVRFLEEHDVFRKSTVGVYVLVTKCDMIPCQREDRPKLAYEYVTKELLEFWGPLERVVKRTGVGDLGVLSYSVGDVFAQKLCRFDPQDTDKVIKRLLTKTPAIGGWTEWLKG